MRFHEVHRFRGEVPDTDALAVARHDLRHARGVQVGPAIQRAAQVAVGVDPEDAVGLVHHDTHAEPLAGHFQQALRERGARGHARDVGAAAHDVLDVQQQAAAQ